MSNVIAITYRCDILQIKVYNLPDYSSSPRMIHHGIEIQSISCPLPGLGNADSVVAKVVDRVPLSQECVTENGEWPSWSWNVEAHEGTDAVALDLENVVVRTDCEVVASQSECEVLEGVTLVALDSVLAVVALLAPISLLRSSASVLGRAMSEVPVSRIAPVLSSSAVWSP